MKQKFRAWDKDTEEMRDVLAVDFYNLTVTYTVLGLTWDEDSGKLKGKREADWNDLTHVKIIQFTGLKDKRGVEIFEGDIVELLSNKDDVGTIEFGHQDIGHDWQGVGFYVREKDGSQFNIYGGKGIEVIGNIYESPELLK